MRDLKKDLLNVQELEENAKAISAKHGEWFIDNKTYAEILTITKEAIQRALMAETQCAVMRTALVVAHGAIDRCIYDGGLSWALEHSTDIATDVKYARRLRDEALSTSAGRDLLERVQAVIEANKAYKAAVEALFHSEDADEPYEVYESKCKHYAQCFDKLREAVAALEGGVNP